MYVVDSPPFSSAVRSATAKQTILDPIFEKKNNVVILTNALAKMSCS